MSKLDLPTTRQTLADHLNRRLRDALLNGSFKSGQRLSEPELASMFKVSRSPIREAIARLEHEGFLERLPNGRISVRPLHIPDLQQLYVLRATVEGLAARLAAPQLRTVDLEAMGASMEEMERCVRDGDAIGAIAAGQEFHDVIIRECGNQPLVETLGGLRARIGRFRALVASFGDYDPERVAEHRRILDAFYARDPVRAEAEMTRHVERSADVLVARLRQREND
ncbi:GntR family transcriptional regulator [Pigmentiphaga soli]